MTNEFPRQAIIALNGPLGAGKTEFVRRWVESNWPGMGKQVVSPTFILHAVYETPDGPVHHMDWYRMENAREVLSLGWDELIQQPFRALFIEWAERFESILPKEYYKVRCEYDADRNVWSHSID